MDHLAVTTDDFDALLDASSLGAPHVLAQTEPIPAAPRRRMAQAVDQQQARPETRPVAQAAQEHEQDPSGRIPGESPSQARPLSRAAMRPRRPSRPLLFDDCGRQPLVAALRELRGSPSSSYAVLAQRMTLPGPGRWEAGDRWTLCVRGFLLPSLPPYSLRDPLTAWPTSRTGGGPHQAADLLDRRQLAHASREPCPAGWRFPRAGLLRCASADTASGWARGEMTSALSSMPQHTGRSWLDLQAYLQPVLVPTHDVMLDSVRNLLVGAIEPPHPHVARFAPSAYPRTASGLHVPAGIAAPRPLRDRDAQTKPSTAPAATPAVLAGKQRRARQWITVVDGVRTLRADVPMRIHPEDHEAFTQPVRTRLTYRVCDPYAVEARFGAGSGNETVWTFSRDLLRDGLQKEAGLGDVIVWRGNEPRQQARVFIRLASPEGKALLSAAEHDVRAFVEAAGRLVRYGLEHSYLQPMMDSFEATLGELARPGGRD
ncbi:SsgA family sporulation/cell division regulator [Streptomyces sennicomposti]|uniref:SsgA family sporulation/cell division regulator n=1 Tax=Streptomyces sennicomposti TaxID=2873384 RepID=UPI001CA6E97D|nr:SsgA family sporulation/cell division regulator [Streptomyces sennicomposti]MBY8864517.1 SsgA family sporulation/cell division regulator [Streptomyces sennicomposti]